MIHRGSCHCGRIVFEVEGEFTAAVACNCSICSRKGALLWAVPRGQLRLITSGAGLGTYTFANHAFEHHFCETCGIHPFAEDAQSKSERMAYVNIRCLEGLDLAAVQVIEFDGRSL